MNKPGQEWYERFLEEGSSSDLKKIAEENDAVHVEKMIGKKYEVFFDDTDKNSPKNMKSFVKALDRKKIQHGEIPVKPAGGAFIVRVEL